MTSFKFLDDMAEFADLQGSLDNILPQWQQWSQICINTVHGQENDHQYGVGSLYYDWTNATTINGEKVVPTRDNPPTEADFTQLCDVWRGTVVEAMYGAITDRYVVGRVRIMTSKSKTCLSWHQDDTKRLHYPIKTQAGCMMIIENEVMHLPKNRWCLTDTTYHHTAMNASNETRIHLVAVVLGTL
jgi:hypothetical protein